MRARIQELRGAATVGALLSAALIAAPQGVGAQLFETYRSGAVSAMPSATAVRAGSRYMVTNGASATDCSTGGGSSWVFCVSYGAAGWQALVPGTSQGQQGEPGPAGEDGAPGAAGADGKTVRNGSGVPSSGLGVDGDFYLDTAATAMYGPKTAGTWGSGVSLIGPAGADGADGSAGAAGTNGATWFSGSGAPSGGTGADGDFYFRSATGDVYSRIAGAWSIIANLTGPAGATGADGAFRTVLDETSALTERTAISFAGAGVTCADNPGAARTDCTIPDGGAGKIGGTVGADNTIPRTNGSGLEGTSALIDDGGGVTLPGAYVRRGALNSDARMNLLSGSGGVNFRTGDDLYYTTVSAGPINSLTYDGLMRVKAEPDALYFALGSEMSFRWSSTTLATGAADVTITRDAAGVAKLSDAIRYNPRAAPPYACAAGTRGTVYYDSTDDDFCECFGGGWRSHGAGSCA